MSGTDVHFFVADRSGVDLKAELWPQWGAFWWGVLFVFATFNIFLYLYTLTRDRVALEEVDLIVTSDDSDVVLIRPMYEETVRYSKWMKALAGPFVLACAYRSYLPTQYPLRYVWWDTGLSSILLEKSLAAFGELCFVGQIANGLWFTETQANKLTADASEPWQWYTRVTSVLLVIMVLIGEIYSFAGTITTSNLWYAYEAGCWVLAFLLVWPAFIRLYFFIRAVQVRKGWRSGLLVNKGMFVFNADVFAIGMVVFCTIYVPYTWIVGVPTYLDRYNKQVKAGVKFKDFDTGVPDAAETRYRTHDYDAWEIPILWQTAYFIFVPWMSIALARVPRLYIELHRTYADLRV